MLPIRTSFIFKSRWVALLWAAGILWAAYDFVGVQEQDDNAAATADEMNQALNAF
jgi:hypothetical protein